MLYGLSALEALEALEARRLVDLRDRWLNPPEWVEWVDEPVPGYPKCPVPRDEDSAKALKKRTLSGWWTRTRCLMRPSREPTAGLRTSAKATRYANYWNATVENRPSLESYFGYSLLGLPPLTYLARVTTRSESNYAWST